MKALLTGSRAYGTPTDKSDNDYVVLSEEGEDNFLFALLNKAQSKELMPQKRPAEEDSMEYKSSSFRVGNLNIILVTDELLYNYWAEGTALLVEFRPVPRDVAINVLKGLRQELFTIDTARSMLETWRADNPLPPPTAPPPPRKRIIGGPFWITTTSRSYCIEAESEEAALEWAEENKIGKETVMDCQCLPYPALPRLGKKSICPAFCDYPSSCAGHSSCPRNYACSE